MKHKSISGKYIPGMLALMMLTASAHATSCLWKATSEHGTLYLQGSVHLLKPSDYPLDPAIEAAYTNSDVLVFETDMAKMLSATTQQLIISKAILSGGRTLADELKPKVYTALTNQLAEVKLPADAVQKFKPWFATMTLMVLKMQALGLDPKLGLDQYFYRKATRDKKPMVGLETVKFQINLFDELSEGNQSGYVEHALTEIKQMETMLNDMMKAWKNGNLDKLDKITRAGFKDYPGMYEKFVTDRNKTWVKELDKLAAKDKTCMVVVGVAHLAGKGGLIELLKQKGYTLEQL